MKLRGTNKRKYRKVGLSRKGWHPIRRRKLKIPKKTTGPAVCGCAITTLMRCGCQCGGC